MKVHILNDWADSLLGLPCFRRLASHDVTVWTEHADDSAVLAGRLSDAQALILFRERTPITAELLECLPNLEMISQHGDHLHIDIPACTRRGVLVCSAKGGGRNSAAAAELMLALILASARRIPQQVAALKAGRWQAGAIGQTLSGRTLGPMPRPSTQRAPASSSRERWSARCRRAVPALPRSMSSRPSR